MEINFLFLLAIILITARIFEEIAARLNQPAIVGNLMAGVVLGPMLLNILVQSETLEFFGLLGVMFLMVLTGLEVNLKDIKKITGTAAIIAIISSFIPIFAGITLGFLFGMNIFESIIIGVALSITASAVSAQMLEECGFLKKKIGETLITAGVFNEIICLFTITTLISTLSYTSIIDSMGAYEAHAMNLALFFFLSVIFGYYIFPEIMKFTKKMKSIESSFAISIILIIGFAGVAEFFDLHALIGAFIAGLSLNHYMKKTESEKVFEEDIRSFAEGFMTPIFFVLIGASISLYALTIHPVFVISLFIIAVISKFIGGFIGAAAGGIHNAKESMAIGIGMVAKGSVALVVVHIIHKTTINSPELVPNSELIISALILIIFILNIVVPPFFKKALDNTK